ncbi:hypothetical protein ZTR_09247 [Talaromyces verruculosus]|nr:hypothetical protein ZTR_09247 [Talaromyces verruculosus]
MNPPPYAAVAADSEASYRHHGVASPNTISSFSLPAPEDLSCKTDNDYSFLSKFDTIFLIDDSGSMAGRSWREAEQAIAAIAPICTRHDPNGIDIYFLNHYNTLSKGGGYTNVKSHSAVQEIFHDVEPRGMTPIGQRLREILLPYLRRVEKMAANMDEDGILRKPELSVRPINIIVITDGVFSDDAETVILKAARILEKCDAVPWQIGIQFFQVGTDIAAQKYLEQLDDDLGKAVEGDNVRDIVDTVPWKGQTGRTLSSDGILKVVLGAVNKRYDRQRVGHP